MKTAIFDLDGTLANIEHRLHYIQGKEKDWDAFFGACREDKPIEPTINTLQLLYKAGTQIIILTGRSDVAMRETVTWLEFFNIPCAFLLMRQEGDHRPDHEIKKEMFDECCKNVIKKEDVIGVFEDRQRVVDMWRELGLVCYQVAPGDF